MATLRRRGLEEAIAMPATHARIAELEARLHPIAHGCAGVHIVQFCLKFCLVSLYPATRATRAHVEDPRAVLC